MSFVNTLRVSHRPLISRPFSTSRRAQDVARLTLVGRLARDPEVKVTKSDKEYISYVVGTTNYPGPPPGPDGSRPPSTTTWHRVFSFNPSSNDYLRNLEKGSLVYVEANYEVREPAAEAEPGSPESQRQIFLRHDLLRVLKKPDSRASDAESA